MAQNVQSSQTLYRRTLGEAFDALPPILRRFHDLPEGGKAQGVLRITRGKGLLRHLVASAMRLPAPGEQVPVTLEVQVRGETERWIRDYGALRLVTRQWQERGLLLETAGPLRFGFRLTADTAGMHFAFARCWLVGAPLPYALAPRVSAEAMDEEEGWRVQVRIEVPILGLLTQYEGKVTPQW